MLELLVRIDKVLKRHGTNEIVFNIQGVLINIDERSVKKYNETLLITPMEFDLLLLLVKNKNVALTRDRLLNEVWGINYEGGTRTVDVHIAQIRKKTGLNIVSVPKIGYRLEV
jgi:two-component system, OmpR family, alkaline phosphatase synthesis response regulator PhoP